MTLDTRQIRARADAATPGPWELFFDGDDYGIRSGKNSVAYDVGHKNAQFIAAARTDIHALCNEVDELRNEIALLKNKMPIYEKLALDVIDITTKASMRIKELESNQVSIMLKMLCKLQETNK